MPATVGAALFRWREGGCGGFFKGLSIIRSLFRGIDRTAVIPRRATVNRAILGVLAIPIQDELKLSDVQFGLLSSGIFWTYALVVPFAGLVGDRFDRSRLIGWAAIFWSVMTFCAGFANSFTVLFLLVSVAVVVPQTLYSPTANALISEYHKETRTLALSCHQAAYYTGWFVSGAAVAAVLAFCDSWRWTYFIFGGIGIILLHLLLRCPILCIRRFLSP